LSQTGRPRGRLNRAIRMVDCNAGQHWPCGGPLRNKNMKAADGALRLLVQMRTEEPIDAETGKSTKYSLGRGGDGLRMAGHDSYR
jgi:hypothetical protein